MQYDNALGLDRLTGDLYGASVYDSMGEKIGSVDEIFYDEQTNQPEWLGIGTGFFGTKRVLVPMHNARPSEDGVTVPFDKGTVKDAPHVGGDEIDEATEAELYAYYGVERSESRSDTGLPAGDSGFGDQDRRTGLRNVDEQSMTRSEEELRVGKRSVEAGRARLRKWVETEPVQERVELERETVHVHREPINETVEGARIGEQTIEVPLEREEAVVDKRVVAKERVGLDKDVDRRTEVVSDEVRKERIETDGTTDPRNAGGR
jgi:uncharacterized protein (TIGR02271 family)